MISHFCVTSISTKMPRHKVPSMRSSVCCVLIALPAILAQSATWKFPTKGNGIRANAVDTVMIDWTSTLDRTILRMWCTNAIGDQALGKFGSPRKQKQAMLTMSASSVSSFDVDPSGPLKYVLEDYDPVARGFTYPLQCHGELANKPVGAGIDSPASFEWINNPSLRAKTISQTVTSTPTSSSTQSTFSSPTTSTTTTTTSVALTGPTKSSSATPTITQTSITQNSTPPPSQSSIVVPPSSSPSNNLGAIIGGALGGLALIIFFILALVFLRKYQRKQSDSTHPVVDEPSTAKGSFFGFLKKRKGTIPVAVTGVYEKDNDHRIYEKEGVASKHVAQYEQGHGSEIHSSQIRFSPVELPAEASRNYNR